jgi:hypothetical protein
MSIPHFKSQEDWEAFTSLFDARWHCKKALLDRVKDDMFPGTGWNGLTSGHMEVINDIVQSLLYDVEYTFKASHPDYKDEEDELFIPRRTFKEDVLSALNEALTPYEMTYKECPPFDVLQCADHLTDE